MASDYTPAQLAAWPTFAETWMGEVTTYPTGRGLSAPQHGWICSGCGSGYSPRISRCEVCGPEAKGTQPSVPVMGEWTDEA